MMQWYAEHFGIGLIDAEESPWVYDWVDRHHNHLRWSDATYRWYWVE